MTCDLGCPYNLGYRADSVEVWNRRARPSKRALVEAMDQARTCANGLGHVSYADCEKLAAAIVAAPARSKPRSPVSDETQEKP